ncbi:bud neck involved protein [Gamsiella multidivaricata]|nr:bud neck involved protein [Gamsiella multidivaricata]
MPMSVIPAAIMGIKSTPSYVSLGVINGAVAGPSTTMSTSLLPLVGCDYLNYSSLNDTLTTGAVVAETKPRPLSSMEYAESWLPTATPSTDAPECNLARQNAAYCSSLPENNDPHCVKDTDRVDSIKTVTTLPSNQQSIHPLELHPDQSTNPILLELGQSKEVQAQAQPQQQQPVLRKKSSFAAKLRNVFISKQGTSKDAIETREDILSVSFKDDGKTGTLYVGGLSASLANQHRGSVSSNSSTDTTSGPNGFRRGSGQTTTPSTSPETSPLNSPTVKTCPTLIVPGQQQPSISSLSALDAESETDAEDREPTGFSKEETTLGTNGIYSTPTRAVKKRLSFASISSFFASRNLQERRAKQSRSSSVPHVESRLVVAGRQITEFQRRHSLNDLRDSGTKAKDNRSMNHSTTPPWDRDRATSQVSPAPSHSTPTIPAPTKKLSLNNVFNKQIKRRNKTTHVPAPAPSAAKPLKSALAHRPPVSASPRLHHVHTASRRRSASIRSQSSSQHRRHYHNHQQQRHSAHHSSATEDPFIRLAQANHALATLNKKGSRGSESQIKDSYLFETQDPPYEAPGSLLKDTPQRITHLTSRDTAPFGSCTPSTPPTPRVLPVSTSKVAPSASADRCQSPPQNSLATLSRPSSCCSLESAYEGANTSSSASDDSSFSSSFSAHYEASGASRSRQQGVRRTSTGQAINTLLPTSAARVSVDNIAMETQVKRSTAGGVRKDDLGNFLTPESYSTMSNSSTAASSTSSPSTKVSMHLEEHRLAGVGGTAYHHLRCQQQLLAREPYDPHPMHEYYAEHEKEHDHLAQDHHLRHHYLDELEPQHQHYHHGERGYYYTDPSFYQARPRRQIQFSTEEPTVYPTWTPEQYDRTADTSITASCLTPAIAQKIKLELNHFKSQEMKVHQDSRIYTHFFV